MIFSSTIFIFGFLPTVLLIYFVLLAKANIRIKNIFLFLVSVFFYAWGEPKFVFVFLFSIFFNWFCGLKVDAWRASKTKTRMIMVFMIIVNISILFIHKYLLFSLDTINGLFGLTIPLPHILLPIGISFFTFQAVSYVIDVKRNTSKVQKNPLDVGLYVAFFPQLVAGPIVRYSTIAEEIQERHTSWDDFSTGICRFILGFAKKTLIADNLATIADKAFAITGAPSALSVVFAWMGALAFMLQIYYDFSGYSDMAIGLGRIFGFHFMENFNYPYIAHTITNFWRRWHISLSSWLRDYIYIPLGGSRVESRSRMFFNLFVVWLATGIWHGANWTFIAWGIYYFLLIAIEKALKLDRITYNPFSHLLCLFLVLIGWVLFRSNNIGEAILYIQAMFGLLGNPFFNKHALFYLQEYGIFYLVAIIFALPIVPKLKAKLADNKLIALPVAIILVTLFIVSISFIIKGNYNPFIYFNF
ncbi:MAG: MBOAT family O-acyltransferase [Clostridiales bacterium]